MSETNWEHYLYWCNTLECKIAWQLGYSLVKLEMPEKILVQPPGVEIVLTHYVANENGENISGNWQSPALAWEHTSFPDWTNDLNEAIKLLKSRQAFTITWDIEADEWNVSIDGIRYWNQRTNNPALTICKAWLQHLVP